MQKRSGAVVYSPSDLIRYFASPFASWMDRYYLENPDGITPDEETEDQKLVAQTGDRHEISVLTELKAGTPELVEIPKNDFADARAETLSAMSAKVPIIFQAALDAGQFAGFADFLILDGSGRYQVWDTKLARAPKPYYAIQLCCYAEMLAAVTGEPMSEKFGIILGSNDRVEFRVEDFIHYYRCIKTELPGHAGRIYREYGRSPGTNASGRARALELSGREVLQRNRPSCPGRRDQRGTNQEAQRQPGLQRSPTSPQRPETRFVNSRSDSFEKLVAQARLQCRTREDRKKNPEATPRYEILPYHRSEWRVSRTRLAPSRRSGGRLFRHGGLSFSGGRTGIPVRGLWVKRTNRFIGVQGLVGPRP